MADLARTGFHLFFVLVLVAGLWVYAAAKSRAANPWATWFDGSGVMHTGNPYGPIDKTPPRTAVAQADLYDEIEP